MKALFVLLFVLIFSTAAFSQKYETPTGKIILYADGVRDDTEALNAWGDNKTVYYKDGKEVRNMLQNKQFLISWYLKLNRKDSTVRFCTFIVRDYTPFRRNLIDFRFETRHFSNYLYREYYWNRGFSRRRAIRLD